MALQRINQKELSRAFKRRKRNQRRARRMENAVRRNLYLDPLARIVEALARLLRGGK